ncbi:MAG: 3-oxoacid CoA-transferase [Leptospiraceae bacterium]|nr:3-oxoacid CoA-transferase [Leptospiraceae bacterium]
MYLHLASTMSRPNALIYALIRVFYKQKADFTISVGGLHSNAHALTLSGIIKKGIISFAGDNYPRPSPNSLYSRILTGKPFQAEIWSLLTLVQRLMAGAMRLNGFVTNSLVESDMAKDKLGKNLFLLKRKNSNEKKTAFITPLNPDITLLHGVCGDEDGNIMLTPPLGEGIWSAFAATKGVLASVEKIVPSGTIPPELVTIPGCKVTGICEARYGVHPQSLRVMPNLDFLDDIKTYYDDYEFQIMANRSLGAKMFDLAQRWMEEYVLLKDGHKEYLDVLTNSLMRMLDERPMHLPPKRNLRKNLNKEKGFNDSEQMIILAARAIVRNIKENGYKTVLAGIGAAHIASWTARKLLEKDGMSVNVLAELGFYNMIPYQGDIFLFSQQHQASQFSDVGQILGTLVPQDCLGVLGAAEVDILGNLNSTRMANGKFIVGSGGANDIASTADCLVIVRAGRTRFVQNVNYITSPGKNVKEVVCQFGSFSRQTEDASKFYFSNWLAPPSEPEMEAMEAVIRFTDWTTELALEVYEEEPPITKEELEILHSLDPNKVYTEEYLLTKTLF